LIRIISLLKIGKQPLENMNIEMLTGVIENYISHHCLINHHS
jgi:hypothetical protein